MRFHYFLRVITRIYVLNGGDPVLFVNSWWYLCAILLHTGAAVLLYFILSRAYPETQTTGPKRGI